MSKDGRVSGTYVHGLFTGDAFRKAFLAEFGANSQLSYGQSIDAVLDDLAAHLEKALDVERLMKMATPPS